MIEGRDPRLRTSERLSVRHGRRPASRLRRPLTASLVTVMAALLPSAGCGGAPPASDDATPVPWQGQTPTPTDLPSPSESPQEGGGASPTPTVTPPPGTPTSSPVPEETPTSATPPMPTPTPPAPCEADIPAAVLRAIPEDHACIHFEEGPVRTATAAQSPEDAPDISRVHTRFDLTLSPYGGGWGGWVKYTGDAGGYHALFSSLAIPITLYGPELTPQCAPVTRPPRSCDAFMAEIYVTEWEAYPVYIELGPGGEETLQITIEEIEAGLQK